MSFENCNAEEIEVFERIASGALIEDQNPRIIQSLLDLNLLSHLSGRHPTASDLTVPAIVMSQWEKFKREHPEE
jgi:hypothetical protein